MSDLTQECITYKAKRAAALLYTPPVRYKPYNPYVSSNGLSDSDLVKLPYTVGSTTYTPEQLAMRRKAEILQYKKNGANSGAAVKSKQWANIARSNGKTFIPVNIKTDCGSSMSNMAGVPGPPIPLFLDTTVPLYNFIVTPTYATELKEDPTIKWRYNAVTDITSLVPHILTFSITPAITSLVTNFTIKTPVNISLSGTCNRATGTDVSGVFSVGLNVSDVRIITYYGGQLVNYVKQPYAVFNTTFRSNIAGQTLSTVDGYQFSGTFYMGMLEISNLYLPTSPGYTYDICLNYQPNIVKDTNIGSLTVTFTTNTTSNNNIVNHMVFTTMQSPDALNPIDLTSATT